MSKFKFENCTSKQFVRDQGWIPEGKVRRERLTSSAKTVSAQRRIRYLTFCAEGALDVRALERAKVLRKKDDQYDTVFFFDLSQQGVDRTLDIIEGATGFPVDFFKLMTVSAADVPDDEDGDVLPQDAEESVELFEKKKEEVLYFDLRKSFPFDLINLDVERYVIIPEEQVPGKLLEAWDKLLLWQQRKGVHGKKEYELTEFTVFFTTRVGPSNLPDEHRDALVDVIGQNLSQFPSLKGTLKARFNVDAASDLYDKKFDEFLKLAVPKALVSRALARDWALDIGLSYKAFEFTRETAGGEPYTMLHFILHFRRCEPSLKKLVHPLAIPPAVRVMYEEGVRLVFETPCENVDALKVSSEEELKAQLAALGVQ